MSTFRQKHISVNSPSKRDRTRAKLLEVALALFERQGYEQTSVGEIAAAAGVVRQTVVNHFSRKDDFVAAWGEQRRAWLAQQSPDTTLTPRAAIAFVFDRLAERNESERALTAALHPHYLAVVRPPVVPAAVLSAVERAQAAGDLRSNLSAAMIAQVLMAIYFDTLTRWLTDPAAPPLAESLHERIGLVVNP